jgi:ABC-type phosphate/phosphonate transport system substrate-binding protein
MDRRGFISASVAVAGAGLLHASERKVLTVIVMDPLAAPLSCPCVAGYAQRDYEKLGKFLEAKLGTSVQVYFNESLDGALTKKTAGKADLIIGKDSVVRFETHEKSLPVIRLVALTDKDGVTTQTGLFVVASSDAATSTEQLKGYKIFFGPKSADEKHSAARQVLTDLNVPVTGEPEICVACSDGATKVMDLAKQNQKACTVISSYAKPLLEGCGTVKKGDLKIVGKTDPVPFISAFAVTALGDDVQAKIKAALLEVGKDAELCKVLESKSGFVDPQAAKKN